MLVPVILSGGAGTRLWPLSRELYPKQLLPLVGEHTLLQDTVLRHGVRADQRQQLLGIQLARQRPEPGAGAA